MYHGLVTEPNTNIADIIESIHLGMMLKAAKLNGIITGVELKSVEAMKVCPAARLIAGLLVGKVVKFNLAGERNES